MSVASMSLKGLRAECQSVREFLGREAAEHAFLLSQSQNLGVVVGTQRPTV